MSDPTIISADRSFNGALAAACVNDSCVNVFDPAREGFNGECDSCAALAADHFSGGHGSSQLDCPFCWDELPVRGQRVLVAA